MSPSVKAEVLGIMVVHVKYDKGAFQLHQWCTKEFTQKNSQANNYYYKHNSYNNVF
jgi:hypothetical protein